ncbi:hypothetical protein OIU25_32490 [Rhizobium sp. BT-175]|nr:hypothetical protein [Rhizobium sp. BT-175]MCV9947584.1 hypothetical protein [Rhizobium sp. BT-175]
MTSPSLNINQASPKLWPSTASEMPKVQTSSSAGEVTRLSQRRNLFANNVD